jgi:DNA-binding MarR family transcriptional regulator
LMQYLLFNVELRVKHGVSYTHFLNQGAAHLTKGFKKMTTEELAGEMGETHGRVVHKIDALQKAKLIESLQSRNTSYGRVVTLTLTGRTVAAKLKEI